MEGLLQRIHALWESNPEFQLHAPGGVWTDEAPPSDTSSSEPRRPVVILSVPREEEEYDTGETHVETFHLLITGVAEEAEKANRAAKLAKKLTLSMLQGMIRDGDTKLDDEYRLVGWNSNGGAPLSKENMDDGILWASVRMIEVLTETETYGT